MALSGSLKVEGVPREDIPRSQDQTAQHSSQTVVPSTTPPAPIFGSVVAHRRPGGQSVSVKVVQAHLSFTAAEKPTFEKLGQMFVEIGEGTANVSYVVSVARAEFGEKHTLVRE